MATTLDPTDLADDGPGGPGTPQQPKSALDSIYEKYYGAGANPTPAPQKSVLDSIYDKYYGSKPAETPEQRATRLALEPAGPYADQTAAMFKGAGALAKPSPSLDNALTSPAKGPRGAEPSLSQQVGLDPTGLPGRVADALGEMATHPIQTATGMVTAPVDALLTLEKYGKERAAAGIAKAQGVDISPALTVTHGQAALAALQLGSLALPGVAGKMVDELTEPFLGEIGNRLGQDAMAKAGRAVAIGKNVGVGAGVGAAFSPQDPAVGAVLGGAAGGAHATASGERVLPNIASEPAAPSAEVAGRQIPSEAGSTTRPVAQAPANIAPEANLPPEEAPYSTESIDETLNNLAKQFGTTQRPSPTAAPKLNIAPEGAAPPPGSSDEGIGQGVKPAVAPAAQPQAPPTIAPPVSRETPTTSPSATVPVTATAGTVQPREVGPAAGGAATPVILPDGRTLQAKYAVVDAGALIPSHNAQTFEPNPEYPASIQGRAYHGARGAAAREAVVGATAQLDPNRLLDAGNSVNGPPVITPDGYAVIGNQRTMMLQRAAAMSPGKFQAYKQQLALSAPRFGLDPSQVASMQHPVLVRVLNDPGIDTRNPQQLADINRVSDIAETKAKDAASEGASRAQALLQSPGSLAHLANTIQPDDTISDYLTSKDGGQFVRGLIGDGVIGQQEAGRFIDPRTGTVTPDGREVVRNMLYAAAVPDPDVVERAPKSVKQKIEHAIPAIVQANLAPGYDVGHVVAQALDLLHSARSNGHSVADEVHGGLLPREPVHPIVAAMAEDLEQSNKAAVTQKFRQYAALAKEAAAAQGSSDMFGYTPPTREEMLTHVFASRVGEGRVPYDPELAHREFMSNLSRGVAPTNPAFASKATQTLADVLHPRSSPIRSRPIPRDAPWLTSRPFGPEYKNHPDFAAAKAGDPAAAVRFVTAMVNPDSIIEAKQRFGPNVIYAAPHAMEETGPNAIPQTLARLYADATGAQVGNGILQANRVHHTGADMMGRLVSKPEFVGPVQPGGKYVLVDDVITSGGTLAGMADYVQQQGGQVVGILGLANGARPGQLGVASPRIIQNLEQRGLGHGIRETVGIEPRALTAGEASYLIGFRSPDELRARAARALATQRGRLRPQSVLPTAPDSGPAAHLPSTQAGSGSVAQGQVREGGWRIYDARGRLVGDGAPDVGHPVSAQQHATILRQVSRVADIGLPTEPERRSQIETASKQGLIDPVGRRILNDDDLVSIMRAFRNPSMEILHAFIVDGKTGTVLHHQMVASGAIDHATFNPEWVERIASVARPGQDVVMFGHNHPSGDPTASGADRMVLANFAQWLGGRGIHVAGQFVIDHDHGTWQAVDHEQQLIREHSVEFAPQSAPWKTSFEVGYPHLRSLSDVGSYLIRAASPDAFTAVLLDTQHGVIALAPVLKESLPTVAGWLPSMIQRTAAFRVIFMGEKNAASQFARNVKVASDRAKLADVAPGNPWWYPILDVVGVRFSANGTPLPEWESYAASGLIAAQEAPDTGESIPLQPGESAAAQVAASRAGQGIQVPPAGPGESSSNGGRPGVGRTLQPPPEVRERDLFGNEDTTQGEPPQGSLFSSQAGSTASRSLAETERAARAELAQIEQRERLVTSPLEQLKIARRKAELQKLVNRDKAIGAEELKTRARAGENADLFGGGVVKEPPPPSAPGSSGYGHIPIPEPSGFRAGRAHIRPFEFGRKIKSIFNPEALGPEARGTGGTIRHETAVRFRAFVQAEAALDSLEKYIEKHDNENKVRLWDAYERGIPSGDPYVDAANKIFAEVTEQRTKELIRMGRLDAKKAVENYIGRFWSVDEHDPEAYANFLRTIVGRRPFEGPKSFLKERSWENMTEGLQQIHEAKQRIAAGTAEPGDLHTAKLRPATLNYVTSQKAKLAEMERLIGADHMLALEQAAGRAKPVMDVAGVRPPVDGEGRPWVKIDRDGNDPAFTVWGPRTIEHFEAVDHMVYQGLKHLMDDLDVRFKRPVNIGGQRLGFAYPQAKVVVTKFGGPMGVIVHEIGHVLDEHYGLGKRIDDSIGKAPTRTAQSGKKKGQQVPDYSKKGGDTPEMRERRKTLRDELRNLANLRLERYDTGVPETKDLPKGGYGGRSYLHSTEEKMANMVDAYVTNPERMKQVAPGIYDIFDKIVSEHPELSPLKTIKPSLSRESRTASTELPGPMIVGHWYAPAASAAVWNNHLSRGLRGNPIYDAATAPGYAATQMLLGVSGFHGTVIATEGMFSDMVMAAEHAMAGEGKETAKSLGSIVGTPVTTAVSSLSPKKAAKAANLAFGAKVMQEYKMPGSQPALANVLDAMIAGGFRGTAKSELWTGERTQALKRAVGQALRSDSKLMRAWGASKVPLDTIFAGIELAAQPLMGKYVPLMKTAATYRAVAQRLTELPPDLAETDPDRFHKEMWDIVKEMDLRFGQVIYDNHFINRFAKDLAQAMFLAPGWTFGTLDLMTRGGRDLAMVPKRLVDRAKGKPEARDQPIVGRSGKYWIAAVIGTMILNGLLTKLATGENPGQGPDGWKDFFAFRDGTKDANGNPNRHTIPGYLMHDVYGWTHHPLNTFLNKLSPFFAFGSRVAQNRDFYGNMIYDPDASALGKARDIGKATAKEFSPLSMQNYLEGRHRGEHGGGELARNAFGVTPAKREFTQTKAQNMMDEYLGRRPHDVLTPQEAQQAQSRRALRDSLQRGETTLPHVLKLEIAGELTPRQGQSMMTGARKGALLSRYEQLRTDAQKVKVYEAGQPWEQEVWRMPYLMAAARLRVKNMMTAPPR